MARLALDRGLREQAGMALIIAVLMLLMLSAIGVAAFNQAGSASEGTAHSRRTAITFHVADAGIQYAVSQVLDEPPRLDAFDVSVDDGSRFRSGPRTASVAQTLPNPEPGPPPEGFSLNVGSGYATQMFRTPVTAFGPGSAMAELEAKVIKLHSGAGGYR